MIHILIFTLFVSAISSSLISYEMQQYAVFILFIFGSLVVLKITVHSKRKFIAALFLIGVFFSVKYFVLNRVENQDKTYASGFEFKDKAKIDQIAQIAEFPNYKLSNNQYVLHLEGTDIRVLVTALPYQKFGYLESVSLSGKLEDVRLQDAQWHPYYRKLGVHYTMYNPAIDRADFERTLSPFQHLKLRLFAFKTYLRQGIIERFSSHASALVLGMLLGERDELSKAEKDIFNRAGLSHILVVSGYNISLMISFVFIVSKFLSRSMRTIVALVTIILFVLLVGYDASVVRAALMGSIIIFSKINMRPSSALNVLLLVATIMLMSNPFSIFDAGFHLSFIATFSLLIMPRFKRIPEFVGVSAWVFVMVLPYVAYLSETVSLAGIASNIAVVLLLPVFMLVSLASLAFIFTHIYIGLDQIVLETMSRYVFFVARAANALPSVETSTPPSVVMAAYVLVFALIVFSKNRYSAKEFIERRYQKFVPLRPS